MALLLLTGDAGESPVLVGKERTGVEEKAGRGEKAGKEIHGTRELV